MSDERKNAEKGTEPYPYRLVRSERRTLSLEITAALEVVVRAPRRCPEAEIRRFVATHEAWLEKHMERQRQRQQQTLLRAVTPEQEEQLRRRAEQEIPERVAYYSARMGLIPAGVRITGAQKRFGSCSGRNRLCFSWRLMQYPPEAVDYVVVHELAHIRHHNHSPAFYALVEQFLPDYRQRQALLRN